MLDSVKWSNQNLIFSICLVLNPPFIEDVNDAGESFGIEGEAIRLSCNNEDDPFQNEEFRWFDSEGVALGLFGIIRPHVLTLPNATCDQSGVYVCVVSVQGGSVSVNTTLIVQCKWTLLKSCY